MGQACFVVSAPEQPSARWMTYPAVEAGWPVCTIGDAVTGFEPEADTYVVQLSPVAPPIARWQAKGKGVFFWIDDAVWMMPIRTRPSDNWKKLWPDVTSWLRMADGIIAPNRILAEDMELYNRNSVYIPNYHGYSEFLNYISHVGVWGYGGSYYHWISWRDTAAWDVIPANSTVEIIASPQLASAIEMHRPDLKVLREDLLPIKKYLQCIARWSYQIIPLHGDYDRRRSWIKPLESFIAGTSWLGVGDAIEDAYADVPVCTAKDHIAFGQEWAWKQHIKYHIQEWKEVLDV